MMSDDPMTRWFPAKILLSHQDCYFQKINSIDCDITLHSVYLLQTHTIVNAYLQPVSNSVIKYTYTSF